MTYEQSMAELEKIVEKLSGQKLTIEESLTLYKEGISLAKIALQELDQFKGSIELLNKDLSEMEVALEEDGDDADDDPIE